MPIVMTGRAGYADSNGLLRGLIAAASPLDVSNPYANE